MVFKNKVIELKLQNLLIIGFDFFFGKYFDVLYFSVENIRDVKEIQYLRGKDNYVVFKKCKFDQRGDVRLNEVSVFKVFKRIGSKGIENRNFKKRNNYYDKLVVVLKKFDNNQLGF